MLFELTRILILWSKVEECSGTSHQSLLLSLAMQRNATQVLKHQNNYLNSVCPAVSLSLQTLSAVAYFSRQIGAAWTAASFGLSTVGMGCSSIQDVSQRRCYFVGPMEGKASASVLVKDYLPRLLCPVLIKRTYLCRIT